MKTMRDLVAAMPFFAGMEPAYLDLIAGCAHNVRYDDGDFIFRDGANADAFVVLTHGRAAVEVFVPPDGARIIRTSSAGETLGFSWLMPPHRYRYDVRALELVRAVSFDGRCLRDKAASDCALGYELMVRFATVVIADLEQTRAQLVDMYAHARAR